MSSYSFDANIVIDALLGHRQGLEELSRATADGQRAWISRIVWIEVMSKGTGETVQGTEDFLSGFDVDELDKEIASRAAALRREGMRLRSADAVILASAQVRGRILVTRNTKDFPANMPGVRVPYIL
ncbi:MAG: type II toxin-antitoxin system VapC family toxin [Sphingosinicella sp.]